MSTKQSIKEDMREIHDDNAVIIKALDEFHRESNEQHEHTSRKIAKLEAELRVSFDNILQDTERRLPQMLTFIYIVHLGCDHQT